MDVRMIELSACAVVAVAIVARIFWLFTNRVPVLARSENVDALGESLPGDPLNPVEVPQGLGRMSPFHTADRRVEYELGGKRYEHDVETHSIDGLDVTGPDDMPILWADPKNPARVAAHGPGFWFLALLVVGLCAALVSEFAA